MLETDRIVSDIDYVNFMIASSDLSMQDKKDLTLRMKNFYEYVNKTQNFDGGVGDLSGVDTGDNFWEWLNKAESDAETTYISQYDPHFKWKKGWLNTWTGYSGEGKSTWLYFLLLIRVLNNPESKIAVFTPENYPKNKFYKDWIKTMLGKDPKTATEAECMRCIDRFKHKLFYVYPNSHDIDTIEDNFRSLINMEGVDVVVVDPYLKVRGTGYDVGILKDFMQGREQFTKTHQVIYNVVFHQLTPVMDEKTGQYKEPDKYSIKGGGNITDSSDTVSALWRPMMSLDPNDNSVMIKSMKIKDYDIAKPGKIYLHYKLNSNRFYLNDVDLFEQATKQESLPGNLF